MPEEAKGKEDAQQAVEVAAGGDKTKTLVMILIVLAVLVMVCTPVVTIFAMKSMIQPAAVANPKEAKSSEKFGECSILKQMCVIGHTKGSRFVNLDVIIRYSEPTDMAKYFSKPEGEGASPESIFNSIKAEITKIIMDKNLDELDGSAGVKVLCDQIKEAVNSLLPKSAKGRATEVIIPSLMIT